MLSGPRALCSAATAKEIAARHMHEEGPHETVDFDFIGGEPLLVWDVIVSLVEYVHSQKWPKKFAFSFTTNGTLFTDDIKVCGRTVTRAWGSASA